MWRLVDAAKAAKENATDYVVAVQQKASDIVSTVQDEATNVLQAMAYPAASAIDEPVYEELEAFEAFKNSFDMSSKTGEIEEILNDDNDIAGLYTQCVPSKLSQEEFWLRYFFRQVQNDNSASALEVQPTSGLVPFLEKLEEHVIVGNELSDFNANENEKQIISILQRICNHYKKKSPTINASIPAESSEADNETKLWKARALKMKNAKKEAEEKAEGYLTQVNSLREQCEQLRGNADQLRTAKRELDDRQSEIHKLQDKIRILKEEVALQICERQKVEEKLTVVIQEQEQKLRKAEGDAQAEIDQLKSKVAVEIVGSSSAAAGEDDWGEWE